MVAVTGPAINANNENNRVVSAVLCSALYPNIVKVNLVIQQENRLNHQTVLPKVLTPEQKYMQTATGAMAKPPNPEDLKFKTAVDGYVHLHPGSVTAKVVRSVFNITFLWTLLIICFQV